LNCEEARLKGGLYFYKEVIMANPDTPNGASLYRCDLPSIPTKSEILKNGVTIAKNDLLIIGTDGFLDICVATSPDIYGVANYAATGDGSTKILYTPALPGLTWEMQCSGTGAQTDIGEAVDMEGGTGVMEINENANSTKVLKIIEKHPDSAYGANTRFIVAVNKSGWVSASA
jgi:hypothetical protein